MPVPRRLRMLLGCGLLTFVQPRSAYPQEIKSTDSQPKKPVELTLRNASAGSGDNSAPLKIEKLSDLASRLLRYTGDAGCRKGDCKILVTNFLLTTGYASPWGIQMADDLAGEFARQDKTIQLIDRNLYKDIMKQLEEEQIPIKLLNSEDVARWLGVRLGATIVMVGTTKGIIDTNIVELSARFLNALDENKIGPSAEVDLTSGETLPDLSPIALPQLPSLPDNVDGEAVYHTGTNGVGLPNCFYMPNPSYTQEARAFHFSGTILVDCLVKEDGTVKLVQFLRGAPYGMDDSALKTVSRWKCKPAILEGKPVATIVPIEVTFHSF